MSWLRDVANYIGVGDESRRTSRGDRTGGRDGYLAIALRTIFVVGIALIFAEILDFGRDLVGVLGIFGLVAVLAVAVGLVERTLRQRADPN